ncbi:hypothetical protein BB561_004367 [Smittium simulii]|uniref:Uncharacterized protein n=1 Tax=Smittium simulii TaxID=133385 RepID=A0A2T9YGT0_9FUNG|nr:hypothetical protein BB561_004367 [Smittium simulii]
MALFAHIFIGSFSMFTARAYATLIEGKPVFKNKIGYVVWSSVGGYLGYALYQFRLDYQAKIDQRYKLLSEQREKRKALETPKEQ